MPHHVVESMNEFVVAPTTLFGREKRLLKRGSLNHVPVLYSNSIENWTLCGETYARIEIHGGKKDEDRKNVGKPWKEEGPPTTFGMDRTFQFFPIFCGSSPLRHNLVAVFYRMEDTKTVSVRMSDEEVRALSRTRRRRHKVKADREPRANLEMEKEPTQEPVVQKIEAPASVPSIPKGTTTAAIPAVPVKPRIVFTKKNHITKNPVTIEKKLVKKPVLVVGKVAGTVSKVSAPPITAPTVAPAAVSVGGHKKRTRKFKSRHLKMTLHARGPASKQAAKRVAAMSITDVRAQLVAAGLLKGKSRSPPDVLRGMLTEWLQLHAGA